MELLTKHPQTRKVAHSIGDRLGGRTWIIPAVAGVGAFALNRMLAKRSYLHAIASSIGFAVAMAGLFATDSDAVEKADITEVPVS